MPLSLLAWALFVCFVLEKVEHIIRRCDKTKSVWDYMVEFQSSSLLWSRHDQWFSVDDLDYIHHLNNENVSDIGAANEVIILSVAETCEELRPCVRLERISGHILEISKTSELFLLAAVKLETVFSSNNELLIVSGHICNFVNNEVKLSKGASLPSLASHKHIIGHDDTLTWPISYANWKVLIILTESKGVGIPLIHLLLGDKASYLLFFLVVNIKERERILPLCCLDIQLLLALEYPIFNRVEQDVDVVPLLALEHPLLHAHG